MYSKLYRTTVQQMYSNVQQYSKVNDFRDTNNQPFFAGERHAPRLGDTPPYYPGGPLEYSRNTNCVLSLSKDTTRKYTKNTQNLAINIE